MRRDRHAKRAAGSFNDFLERKPFRVVAVAVANKMTRVARALLARGVAMQRAGASVARIDAALVEAQRCGLMKFFNSRRVAANIAKLPDLLLGALPQACRGTIR